ncbi:MAG: EFR1 family ferrodoxin [Pseudomonadota bacterium]
MDINKIDFYYFSGTGNTLLVAREMKKLFDKHGIQTRLLAIEKEAPRNIDKDASIILAFPVAVFTTYPLVMKFIKGMPQSEGAKVFMVDTMGGASLGIRSYIGGLLRSKGYRTMAARQIVMPDNFWPSPEKDLKNPAIINKAMNVAQKYAKDIIDGKTNWGVFPVLPSLIYITSQLLFKTKGFRTAVKFTQSKCVKCGLCAKLCPIKNIVLREYPVFDSRCELCMRCIAYCPKGAIYRRGEGEHVYRGVKPEELL